MNRVRASLGLSPALLIFISGFLIYVAKKAVLSDIIQEEFKERTKKERQELTQTFIEKFNDYISQLYERDNFLKRIYTILTQAIFQRYPIAKEREEVMNKYLNLLNKIEESSENKIRFMPNEYTAKGDIYFYKEKYDEAINAYNKALENKPNNSQLIDVDDSKANFLFSKSFWCATHCKKGNALASLGGKENNRRAINEYEAALDINYKYYWALHSWGDALYNLSNYQGAIDKFKKALEIEKQKKDTDAQRTTHFRKGVAFATLGKYEDAKEEYNKSVELEFKLDKEYQNCWVWHCRGDTLYMLRNFSDAISDYDLALSLKPSNSESLYKKGLTLYQLGQSKNDSTNRLRELQEANDCFEQAKKEDKDKPVVIEKSQFWYHWGRTLIELEKQLENTDNERAKDIHEQAKMKYDMAQKKLQNEESTKPKDPEVWTTQGSMG